jgi:hypothetical protein
MLESTGRRVCPRKLAFFGGHRSDVRSLLLTCHSTTRQAETHRSSFTPSTYTQQLYSITSFKNRTLIGTESVRPKSSDYALFYIHATEEAQSLPAQK